MFTLKCDVCCSDIQPDFENTCARVILDELVYRGDTDLIQTVDNIVPKRKIICPECKKKIYEFLNVPTKPKKASWH
jgi:hypothetical protein